MEWWYGSEGGASRLRKKGGGAGGDGKALRTPPPPSNGSSLTRKGGKKEIPTSGMCAVHGGEMVNPTALPTGWLGCYKCLFTWVEEEGVCPIEGTKVEVGDLRKIMG